MVNGHHIVAINSSLMADVIAIIILADVVP